MNLRLIFAVVVALGLATPARAYDPPVAMRESTGAPFPSQFSCQLQNSVNGTCGNYKWFNICSGYIWAYGGWSEDESVGVLFGGPDQQCLDYSNCDGSAKLTRVITYYRNVRPGYCCIGLSLESDENADGCPEFTLGSIPLDPGERWNCWEVSGGCTASWMIVRQTHPGGSTIAFATDGPYSEQCALEGAPRSFYYGIDGAACQPWNGPTGRRDNFLVWLIFDYLPTETQSTSWGQIKGLYQ